MRTVRMLYAISGGRADGTEWPLAGELLECDDLEADGLIAGRLAEEVPEERAVPDEAGVEERAAPGPPRTTRPRSSPASSARAKTGNAGG